MPLSTTWRPEHAGPAALVIGLVALSALPQPVRATDLSGLKASAFSRPKGRVNARADVGGRDAPFRAALSETGARRLGVES